jgi:integrase/recombinase XerC
MTDGWGSAADEQRPAWFREFLTDRATRKPSPHTLQAYRQDFDAIASRLVADPQQISAVAPADITTSAMRQAFADFAHTHEAASVRRCWSTWNTLCGYLFATDQLAANPMELVGKPKLGKSLPKSLPPSAVEALLDAIDAPDAATRPTDWPERDRAIVFTAVLAGLRAHELRGANVGDLRVLDEKRGGVLHVHGKGKKQRAVPIEPALVQVIAAYLASRAARFPAAGRRRGAGAKQARWPADAPLFVGADNERITRGVLQYRVLRAFKRAGPAAQRTDGALVHALRHTYATELANANVSVYALMQLLGHESMATSQRYISGVATETKSAAASNPLYKLIGPPVETEQP